MYTHYFVHSFGQLPRECTLDKEVFDFECCPNTTEGICGGPDRGSCEDIRDTIIDRCQNNEEMAERKYCRMQKFLQSRPGTSNTDFRYKWPTQIFERVCVCMGNYDGYNCMRCKRGYTGDDCSQPLDPVVRRNILSFNDSEQQNFINIIQMAKSVRASGYTVPIREPVTNVSSESFVEISLYDNFATFHFNSIRDEPINMCPNNSLINSICNETSEESKCPVPDFAHEGPGFLTWHRGYLLYVETEIQVMLGDPTFALPYWDWTDEDERDNIWDLMGTSNCGIFSDPPNDETVSAPVDGPFSTWDAICTNGEELACNVDNQVCNPTENSANIQRCIGGTQGVQCRVESMLPGIQEVNEALMEQSYDTPPYNKSGEVEGFRNALEGFTMLVNRSMNVCENFDGGFRYTELHNRVHIYIGGTMQSVPTASNDLIFFLHHCNIDRLYEQWLDQYSDENFPSYQPNRFYYDIAPGHNIDEYLVPIFPLVTNRDTHSRATSLGYTYTEADEPQQSGCMGRSQMVIIVIALYLVILHCLFV